MPFETGIAVLGGVGWVEASLLIQDLLDGDQPALVRWIRPEIAIASECTRCVVLPSSGSCSKGRHLSRRTCDDSRIGESLRPIRSPFVKTSLLALTVSEEAVAWCSTRPRVLRARPVVRLEVSIIVQIVILLLHVERLAADHAGSTTYALCIGLGVSRVSRPAHWFVACRETADD